MEKQGERNSKINFKKKKTAGENTLYNVYVFFITAVIKSVGYWQRGRHIDKWNRRVNPEKDTQICPTDFKERFKSNSVEERQPFQQR